jgi:cytochrome c553
MIGMTVAGLHRVIMNVLRGASIVLALSSGAARSQTQPMPADPMAQRMVACTVCHGKEGRATADGYFPRIAGKPAGYLYNQLRHFRDGRRSYPLMNQLLEHMNDAYLKDIANYFANLDVPYPPPQTRQADPILLQRGETLVRVGDTARGLPACAACHGAALMGIQGGFYGNAPQPAMPGLLGLPRDYINAQLGAWKNQTRRADAPDCMHAVTTPLTAEDIGAVSTWLSSQPIPANSKPQATHTAALPRVCGVGGVMHVGK